MSDHCHDLTEPLARAHLRLVGDWRDEIPMGTTLWRRFAGMADDEPTELSIFHHGRVAVAHAMTAADHVRLLQEAEAIEGYEGSYVPVNGPINRGIFYRYQHNRIIRYARKRITDKDVMQVRQAFVDFDVAGSRERVSGISATDEEVAATWGPANECRRWLERELGRESVGFGASGNGHFVLVAVEPTTPTDDTTKRIATFLEAMNKRFGTPGAKVDSTVAHPNRLMPCAGTLKAKGIDTPERPHRRVTFTCSPKVQRVPLEVLA